jgi:hypothetical protein
MKFWGSTMLRALVAATLFAPAALCAQADIALVDLVSGDVTYGSPRGRVTQYMKVREGDRFTIARGGQVRLMYFQSAKQEHYSGPASFTVGASGGKLHSGAQPRVTNVPTVVPGRLSRIPELVQHAKLGGVALRGNRKPRAEDSVLRNARADYDRLRRDAAGDDITPELFLFSALADYHRYDEMGRLADEMLRKQPNNEDVKTLAAWVRTQSEGVK